MEIAHLMAYNSAVKIDATAGSATFSIFPDDTAAAPTHSADLEPCV